MLALRAGTVLGNYEIVRALGSGGVGAVYEARHRALGRRVAVKVLHAHAILLDSEAATARFLREGRAAAQVQHPHVVDVFDFGVDDGVPYLVMELIEGETLAQMLARDGALPLPLLAEIALPVLSAVSALHAAGIIHRDLKPANILLALDRSRALCPKVADFGVSRLETGSVGATESNALVGTFAYMAPEQARASKFATEKSDQYALGVVLYECATGARPFTATSPLELLHAILNETIAAPSTKNPTLPPAFDALVLRALSRDADARFASVDEMARALLTFADPAAADRWAREMVQAAERRAETAALSGPRSGPAVGESPSGERSVPPASSPLANTFQPLVPPNTPASLASRGGETAPPAKRLGRRAGVIAVVGATVLAGLVGAGASRWIGRTRGSTAGATPSASISTGVAVAECHSNAECTKRAGKPSLCAKEKCATLESEDCHVLADPEALAREDTLWFGSMYPLTGPMAEIGRTNERGMDLARQDFVQADSGLRTGGADGNVRAIGLVSCDDAADAARAARHLIDDLGVPAILGFTSGSEIIRLNPVLRESKTLTLATLATSPQLTQLPRSADDPPMVWRMTYSLGEAALAISKFVVAVVEPDLHREGVAHVRVANVRGKAPGYLAFSERLFGALRFNGKSALENGDDFQEIVIDDQDVPDAEDPYAAGLARLRDFAPDIVVYEGGPGIARQIVVPFALTASSSGRKRPRFLSGAVPEDDWEAAGTRAGLRSRVFGFTSYSTTRVNALYTMHFNDVYGTSLSRADAPSTAYDGFYVAAYAAFALGRSEPVSGPSLARAIAKLVPPGPSLDIGPSGIYEGYRTLRGGGSVDLVGAGGNLDFIMDTGEHMADLSVLCLGMDKRGHVKGSVESGMVYSAQTDSLVGRIRCP